MKTRHPSGMSALGSGGRALPDTVFVTSYDTERVLVLQVPGEPSSTLELDLVAKGRI